jgi:transposase
MSSRLRMNLELQLVVVKLTLHEPAPSLAEIAHLVGVPALSPRTVGRWRALYRQRGSSAFAAVHKHAGGRPRKLTPRQEQLVRRLILQNPTAQLAQLRRAIRRRLRISLDVANLSRLLRRIGLSKKVAIRRHKRQDPYDQARYLLALAGTAPANLYFMDESAFAPDVALQTHAWSPIGEQATTVINILSDARYTVCGCIGLREGLVQAVITRESFTKEVFNAFVRNDLVSPNSFDIDRTSFIFWLTLYGTARFHTYLAMPPSCLITLVFTAWNPRPRWRCSFRVGPKIEPSSFRSTDSSFARGIDPYAITLSPADEPD